MSSKAPPIGGVRFAKVPGVPMPVKLIRIPHDHIEYHFSEDAVIEFYESPQEMAYRLDVTDGDISGSTAFELEELIRGCKQLADVINDAKEKHEEGTT